GDADLHLSICFDLHRLSDDALIGYDPVLSDLQIEGPSRRHRHHETDVQGSPCAREIGRELPHRHERSRQRDDDGRAPPGRGCSLTRYLTQLSLENRLPLHVSPSVRYLLLDCARVHGALKHVASAKVVIPHPLL